MTTTLDGYRDCSTRRRSPTGDRRAGRRAPVTPVWCDFDGTHVRINTARGRVKTGTSSASARGAVDPRPRHAYRYVQIRGASRDDEDGPTPTSTPRRKYLARTATVPAPRRGARDRHDRAGARPGHG